MAAPPPPANKQPAKKYQRGQHIATTIGTSDGIQPRDRNIERILASLQEKGAKLLAITGAQADCNPANQDATVGAVSRISPIGLDRYFISESDPPKETIIKTDQFQIRYRGNIIVSVEKELALDYYLCHVSGFVNQKGEIDKGSQPKLLIFADDSDANVFSMFNRFSKNTFFPELDFVAVWFEPTLEQISARPKEADNHQPGIFEKLFEMQKDQWRVEPIREVVDFVYQTWGIKG